VRAWWETYAKNGLRRLVRVDEADELVGVRLRRVVALRQFRQVSAVSVNSDLGDNAVKLVMSQ